MRSGIFPANNKSGSSTLISAGGGGSMPHSSSNLSNVAALPFDFHSDTHCWSIHMPFTIFRKLILPPTAPSLLKLLDAAAMLVQGESSTQPTSDQVPELIKAQSSS